MIVPQWLILQSKFQQDSGGFLQSILNTTRTIRKIMVSFLSAEKKSIVLDILEKFGETIQYLRVCAGNESDLMEAIALVPNVTHLYVVLLSDFSGPPAKRARRYGCAEDNDLNLLRLRKLQIEHAYRGTFLVMFNRLPADVLVELTVCSTNVPDLAELFRKQTKLKRLEIVSETFERQLIIDPGLFDNLQLEYLECHPDLFKTEPSRLMLAKQTNLTELKLITGRISVNLLSAITDNLTKLEIFSICVSKIPVAAIKEINKLKQLKEIAIEGDDEDVLQIKEFATLDNCRIKTFKMQHYHDISDVLIYAMAKSMPNLKFVSFHCDSNARTFYAIFNTFNNVEILHLDTLDILFDKAKGSPGTLLRSGCENPKLTELRILYPMHYSAKYVQKMVADYPNLKKLIITPTNKNFGKQYETILEGFKEMESFSILSHQRYYEERYYDLRLIVNHGRNLKFVALLDVPYYEEDQWRVSTVRKKVDIIKYSRTDGLRMAVDRRTMKLESEHISRYH